MAASFCLRLYPMVIVGMLIYRLDLSSFKKRILLHKYRIDMHVERLLPGLRLMHGFLKMYFHQSGIALIVCARCALTNSRIEPPLN